MGKKIAIVAPCYNEEAVLATSITALREKLGLLINSHVVDDGSCIIVVDDGSSDASWSIIEAQSVHSEVRGIKLSHNVGHQNALLAGIEEALTMGVDATITIDIDLQDDIAVIDKMIKAWQEGDEIVYGVRADRHSDTPLKRWSAQGFYSMMRHSGADVVPNHADFRLMSRRAMEHLGEFGERNLFLRGIVPMIGLPSSSVQYTRLARKQGESKYPFRKMLAFAIEGVTSLSVRPVRMIFIVGLAFLIITLTVSVYVIVSLMMGNYIPGWASLMLSLWFIGSLLLMALGVIGEYVSKIYLEVKRRPRYLIERRTPNRK